MIVLICLFGGYLGVIGTVGGVLEIIDKRKSK
jgi:hypothetical protein